MKEATGDLNSTVITVIAVAAFAVFFFSYLWPMISDTIELNQKCSAAICDATTLSDGMVTCYMEEDKNTNFSCVYKG